MKKITFTLVVLLLSSFLSVNAGVIVIGNLSTTAEPCFSGECPTHLVYQITNDTASFVLVKDGEYIDDLSQMGDYSEDRLAFLYGTIIYKAANDYYELDVSLVLNDLSGDRFSVECQDDDNEVNYKSSSTPQVSVVNDSVIIEYSQSSQCCPMSVLRVSDVINDTLHVFFVDTSTIQCACYCENMIRLNVGEYTSENIVVMYNGTVYDIERAELDENSISDIQLAPNPSDGRFDVIKADNNSYQDYEVYNSVGQLVQHGQLGTSLSLPQKSGIYFLKIYDEDKTIIRKLIIK